MKTRTTLGILLLGAGCLGCWRLFQGEAPVPAVTVSPADEEGEATSRRLSGVPAEEPGTLGIPAPQNTRPKDIVGGSPSPTFEDQIADGANAIRAYHSNFASRWTRLNQLLTEEGEEDLAEEVRQMQMALAMGQDQGDDPLVIAESLLERVRGALSGEEAEALFGTLDEAHQALKEVQDSG